MPSEALKKAVKDGLITQKQYDKMPEKLLMGIVKRGGNGGKKKKSSKKKGKKGKK
jgi:predicted RNA-binding protein associated with RNAse of E/G family